MCTEPQFRETSRLASGCVFILFNKSSDTGKEYPTCAVFEVVLPVLINTPAGKLPGKINEQLDIVFSDKGADDGTRKRVLDEESFGKIEEDRNRQWALIEAIMLFGKIDVVRREEEEDDDERIAHICESLKEF